MVFNCRGFYFGEEGEACGENSTPPAKEKSKKPRGSRVKRVVPVANADAQSRHQTEYDGADDQSKRTIKSTSELGGAKLEDKVGQKNFENSKLSLRQPKGNHGLDLLEPHQKIENSGNQKTQKEHSSRLLSRIRMDCNCQGCAKKMEDIFMKDIKKRFKAASHPIFDLYAGVGSVEIHTDKDLVGVTGTMDTDKLVVYLEEKLREKKLRGNVEVMPIQNDENGASPTKKHRGGVGHIANITDNASRKTEVYPGVQEKQNLDKTELTLPQPRKGDRNDNEVTGMVHLKIRMHCHEGCIPETRKTALKFPGVTSVKVDASKHLVIVVGTINVKELEAYLKEKLKRSVEVTKIETLKEPSAAREDGWQNDVEIKKEVKKKPEEIKNKQKVEDVKVEGKKYSLHDGGYDGTDQRENHRSLHWNDEELHDQNYGMEAYGGYMNQGASYQQFNQSYAPGIFSDENSLAWLSAVICSYSSGPN